MTDELLYQLLAIAFLAGQFMNTTRSALKCLKEGAQEQKEHLDRIESKLDGLPCCQPQWKKCNEI